MRLLLAQDFSVMERRVDMNPDNRNVNGVQVALGHPLGCTGGKAFGSDFSTN